MKKTAHRKKKMVPTPAELAAVRRAIRAAGGQTALADKLGISQGAVGHWWHGRGRIAPERCREVEQLSGVPRAELRPTIFGEAPVSDAAA